MSELAPADHLRRVLLGELRMLNDQVLIRQVPPTDKTASGLHLPDRSKEWPPIGVVVAIGPGAPLDAETRKPMSVAVDDRVLFQRRPSSELEELRIGDDVRFIVLRDEDILGFVED